MKKFEEKMDKNVIGYKKICICRHWIWWVQQVSKDLSVEMFHNTSSFNNAVFFGLQNAHQKLTFTCVVFEILDVCTNAPYLWIKSFIFPTTWLISVQILFQYLLCKWYFMTKNVFLEIPSNENHFFVFLT